MATSTPHKETFVARSDTGRKFRILATWFSGERSKEPEYRTKEGFTVLRLNDSEEEYRVLPLDVVVRIDRRIEDRQLESVLHIRQLRQDNHEIPAELVARIPRVTLDSSDKDVDLAIALACIWQPMTEQCLVNFLKRHKRLTWKAVSRIAKSAKLLVMDGCLLAVDQYSSPSDGGSPTSDAPSGVPPRVKLANVGMAPRPRVLPPKPIIFKYVPTDKGRKLCGEC